MFPLTSKVYPGLFVPIKRPGSVRVRYTDYNNVTKEETFGGFTARIFQHEFDHLHGVCYTDRVGKLKLEMAIKKMRKGKK